MASGNSTARQEGQVPNQRNSFTDINHSGSRNIVLLGKTGVGKSATGNTILGINAFTSKRSVNSVTVQSKCSDGVVEGRNIRVIDTPGFYYTHISANALENEFGRSVYLAEPGVHAFLLVFEFGRITEQEVEVLERTKKVFGEHVTNNIILVFTHGDEVDPNDTLLVNGNNTHMDKILDQCGWRYHIINNKELNNRQQVHDLLQKIENMLQLNGGTIHTNEIYQAAGRLTWEQFLESFREIFQYAVRILNTLTSCCSSDRGTADSDDDEPLMRDHGRSRYQNHRQQPMAELRQRRR